MNKDQQLAVFQEQNGVLQISKPSGLVQINNVTTLNQRKSINAMIRIARDQLKRNPEKKLFAVELGVFKKLSGIARHDNTEIKQALKALVFLVIEYNILGKGKSERGAFPFASFVRILGQKRGGTTTLNFELPTPIIAAIKKPEMYVKLNLFIQRDLKQQT